MHQGQFLNNLKYVYRLLQEAGVPENSDIYPCLISLYTSYKVNEYIKVRAVDKGVDLFMETIHLRYEIDALNKIIAELTEI